MFIVDKVNYYGWTKKKEEEKNAEQKRRRQNNCNPNGHKTKRMEKKIVMVLMMMRIRPEFHRVFINNIEKLLVYMNEGKKILK